MAFRNLCLAYSTRTWHSYSELEALDRQPSRRIPQKGRPPPHTPMFEPIVAIMLHAVLFGDLSVSGVFDLSLENWVALAVDVHLSKHSRG